MSTELAADLAQLQHARFERMWATLSKRQRGIVERALKKFEADLGKTTRGSWGAASKAQTMVQIAQSVKGLSSSQVRSLQRALPGVAERAQASTADWLRILDESFAGTVQPLRWDSLEWLEQERRPLLQSRLRIYRKSFQRYGAEAVAAIESEIVERILTGDPWTDARESVMAIVREQVGDRQWMVDRIIRTESSAAWNGITMAALEAEDADDPDPDDPMLKKLVATFDAVTAEDSRLLHGQTRRLDEMFLDVTSGREYMAPPNRPNDREIVVGWRRSWGDDREFDLETAEESDGDDEGMSQAELDAEIAAAVAQASGG